MKGNSPNELKVPTHGMEHWEYIRMMLFLMVIKSPAYFYFVAFILCRICATKLFHKQKYMLPFSNVLHKGNFYAIFSHIPKKVRKQERPIFKEFFITNYKNMHIIPAIDIIDGKMCPPYQRRLQSEKQNTMIIL